MQLKGKVDIKILIVLVVLFVALGVSSLIGKSPTADELAHHIPTGYVFLKTGDFAYATDAPPLARILEAAPLLALGLELPQERSFWAREDRAEFSREFFYSLNRAKAWEMLFLARLPVLLLAAAGGVFLFFWVRRRYDPMTAIAVSFAYFFSPNIMAHARLATTDMVATVFIMCSVLSFWDMITSGERRDTLIASLFFGLALLSKFSSLMLLPVYIVVGLRTALRGSSEGKEKRFPWRELGIFFSAAFLVLWAGYAFEFKPFLEDVLRADEKLALISSSLPFIDRQGLSKFLYSVPIPLSSYFLGVMGVLKHGVGGARVFFMGDWSHSGSFAYYFMAFLLKTPIPVLISFILGALYLISGKEKARSSYYLSSVILLYFIAASRANLQLGLRYVLPVLPLVLIIASRGVCIFMERSSRRQMVVFGLALWLVAGQFFIWPDYLSYFNIMAGGPRQGHRYLRDSNIDWGQDLPALKTYLDAKDIEYVKMDYFGEGDLRIYGIDAGIIPKDELVLPGPYVYAVSVHGIDKYAWTALNEPSARAGYSIYIYDFREKE